VGHDHRGIFQSPCGIAWLFGHGQCVQVAGTSLATLPKAETGTSTPAYGQ
jgi:hypothetical protein